MVTWQCNNASSLKTEQKHSYEVWSLTLPTAYCFPLSTFNPSFPSFTTTFRNAPPLCLFNNCLLAILFTFCKSIPYSVMHQIDCAWFLTRLSIHCFIHSSNPFFFFFFLKHLVNSLGINIHYPTYHHVKIVIQRPGFLFFLYMFMVKKKKKKVLVWLHYVTTQTGFLN